jgi:hypothetical protein
MADEVDDLAQQTKLAKIEAVGVREGIEPLPVEPREEGKQGGPPEMVPYERVQQQAHQLQELRRQAAEAEERAKNWDMLVNDPHAVELLSGYYRGAPSGSPPSTASQAPVDDDEPVDPHVRRLEGQLQQFQRQMMGVLAPVVQAQAENQRRAIKEIHPEYEPKRDDAAINTIMAQGRAVRPLDAFRILLAERGGSQEPARASKQRAAGTVQAPSAARDIDGLAKKVQQAKARFMETRSDADLERWVAMNGELSGLDAVLKGQFGM